MVTPGAKRDAVVHAQQAFGVSERRACTVIGISRRALAVYWRSSIGGGGPGTARGMGLGVPAMTTDVLPNLYPVRRRVLPFHA
jgi:hypothetical protein